MDEDAKNYNKSAEKDDGSCEYKVDVIEEDENKASYTSDNSSNVGAVLTIGAITAGVYAYNKKKKK